MINNNTRCRTFFAALILTVSIAALAEITLDVSDPAEHRKPGAAAEEKDVPESKPEPKVLALAIDLVDGSRIMGVPGITSVPIETIYAKMDIPLKQIANIKIVADHETAAINLENGDKLKGVLNLKPIELKTIFGTVSINIQHVRSIHVDKGGSIKTGLVLHYSFDKRELNNKVTDKSRESNDGYAYGATWTPQGKQGGALLFDGRNDYIATPEKPLTGKEMTLSMWVYEESRRSQSGNPAYARMLYLASVKGIGASEASSSGGIIKYCVSGSLRSWQDTRVEIPQRTWTHIAFVTKAGDAYRVYINGVEKFKIDNTANIISVMPMYFGVWLQAGRSSCGFFSGKFDEIMLYKRALSPVEIKTLYNSQNR